jgi:diguanylate cyclase (GGDEF)-like protein
MAILTAKPQIKGQTPPGLRAGVRQLARVAGMVLGGVRKAVRGAPVPAEMKERIALDQAVDFSYIMIGISLLGLSTIALVFLAYRHAPGTDLRVALMALIYCSYIALIARARIWLRSVRPGVRDARIYIRDMCRLLIVLGIYWSVLMFVLMRQHNPGQLCLLYGVCVACLATPVMLAPLACALSFWVPISIGILVVGFSANVLQPIVMVNLAAFMVLTGFCVFYLNNRLNERAIGAIRLEENAAVIKLLLRDFEESASDWLWETDAALQLQPVSQRLSQVARRPVESFAGLFPDALLGTRATRDGAPTPGSAMERLRSAIAERSPFRDIVVPVQVAGEERFWSLTGKPILDNHGRFIGYHGVGSDITGQRRQQEHIAFLARHDSLTKLANRVLFSETLHELCEKCEATGIALLCLDLDNFKAVNDTLGHATGDAVLVAVAERIRGCIREFDMAARLGGDEFAAIIVTEEMGEALTVARRIIERIARPFHFDGQMVQIGMSIGITMAPTDGKTPNILMKNADLALYRAKTEGRGVARFYDPEMDERVQDRRILQAALRRAVMRSEFVLHYQPVIEFATGRITGVEALIRWRHPERGLLLPGEFISLAEETGLIVEIGEWVLREACTAAAAWPLPVAIAVNLSPLQLRDDTLVATVAGILESSGLDPARLELEIVESVMLDHTVQTEEALWNLHERGVRIALDDFGTGYSSLSYLRRFPFDKIKIDRSFIRDLGYEKDDSSIILAIIGLAERMNMLVTAEGVESEEQAELLVSYGCPEAQGYLFHGPQPVEDLTALLTRQMEQARGGSQAAAE